MNETWQARQKKPNVFWKYHKSKTTIKQRIGELSTDYTDIKPQTTTKDEDKANSFADFSSVFTTEQPRFIPTMPTVNYKTEMDKLNYKSVTLINHLPLTK